MPYLSNLFRRCLDTFIELSRIMVPIMILVRIGDEFGLSEGFGALLGPVMGIAGLPPEAGLIWAITILTGIYGGIGAYFGLISDMAMTQAQHSVLCALMVIAHFIPVEQAIVRRAGGSFLWTALLRIFGGLLYGGIIAVICNVTGLMSGPAEIAWLPVGFSDPNWLTWGWATLQSLAMMMVIITALFIGLDILDVIGFTRWLTRQLEPLLALIGLEAKLAPLTTVGILLGLTFGGGLIIAAVKENKFSKRSLFLALACLSLSHALIEDTALMLAIGADIWVVLVGRVIFTMVVIAIIAWIWKPEPVDQNQPQSNT